MGDIDQIRSPFLPFAVSFFFLTRDPHKFSTTQQFAITDSASEAIEIRES